MSLFQWPPSSSASANASVGPNGDPIPSESTLIAGSAAGTQTPVSVNSSGEVIIATSESDLATETTQLNNLSHLNSIDGTTAVIAVDTGLLVAKDFATETTLDSINSKDFATEATLLALNSKVVAADTDNVTIISSVLPTDAASDPSLTSFRDKTASSMVFEQFDEQVINYVGATDKIDTIEYKYQSASVAVQTFGYDGSDRLTSITRN